MALRWGRVASCVSVVQFPPYPKNDRVVLVILVAPKVVLRSDAAMYCCWALQSHLSSLVSSPQPLSLRHVVLVLRQKTNVHIYDLLPSWKVMALLMEKVGFFEFVMFPHLAYDWTIP